jgi:hypothetical protein
MSEDGPVKVKRRKPALTSQTRRLLRGVAAKILQEEPQEPITRPKAGRMARYLISSLVPRRPPGKKATPEVLAATALKREGKSWPVIYSQVLTDYSKMPRYERGWRCYRLRRAVAAIFRRGRLRDRNRPLHDRTRENA